jgi:hypothetical protein
MTAASVPSSELYFAVLDRPVSPRGRARAEELAYAFEAAVPVPIDSVCAVYRTLPDARVLAVAIDRARAGPLARTHTIAHPAAWPDWLAPLAERIDPVSVNLLSGPCRSARVAVARDSLVRHALVGLALVALAASIGLERRIRDERGDAAAAQTRASEIYTRALGPAAGAAQPPAARMTSELRRLRATRGPAAATREQTPADTVLAGLLSVWPADSRARTESITVAERTVEVVLRVDDLDAAQAFISALGAAPGLRPGPAKTDREGDEVRLSLRLDREDAP